MSTAGTGLIEPLRVPPAESPVGHAAPDAVAGLAVAPRCVECGAAVADRFCGECGELRRAPGALRMRHLASVFFEHLTSLDFRVARTVVSLVRRPGSLTRDFIAGRHKRHTPPLALYLLVSGGFFLLSPRFGSTLYDPTVAITSATTSTPVGRHLDRVAARRGETRAAMAARVRRSPVTSSRTTAALLAPVIAGAVALLLVGRRRLFAEHVLFAIHLQTFLLLHVAALLTSFAVAGGVMRTLAHASGTHPGRLSAQIAVSTMMLAAALILLGHVVGALARVYSLRRPGAAWRAVLLIAAIPFGVIFGRLVLVYVAAVTGMS